MSSTWLQLITYLTSGTAMIVTATWFLSRQISSIRVELATRVTRAEARIDALEKTMADRQADERAFQSEMRTGHLETIRSLSELKTQLTMIGAHRDSA